MRKRRFIVPVLACACMMFAAGCDRMYITIEELREMEQKGTQGNVSEVYELSTDTSDIAVLEMQYGESDPYPKLAAFLTDYFEVPEEMRTQTRYYYNWIDLNEDGRNEIVTAVVNDELEDGSGHPLLLLQVGGEAGFEVISRIDEVHTPVVVDNEIENGWHRVIPEVYGGMSSPGYRIYHYEKDGYYADEEADFVEELTGITGVQILSDNFIDDWDRGECLTLE
jgi:hypothetical protein